jgi:hypothetical protein
VAQKEAKIKGYTASTQIQPPFSTNPPDFLRDAANSRAEP